MKSVAGVRSSTEDLPEKDASESETQARIRANDQRTLKAEASRREPKVRHSEKALGKRSNASSKSSAEHNRVDEIAESDESAEDDDEAEVSANG